MNFSNIAKKRIYPNKLKPSNLTEFLSGKKSSPKKDTMVKKAEDAFYDELQKLANKKQYKKYKDQGKIAANIGVVAGTSTMLAPFILGNRARKLADRIHPKSVESVGMHNKYMDYINKLEKTPIGQEGSIAISAPKLGKIRKSIAGALVRSTKNPFGNASLAAGIGTGTAASLLALKLMNRKKKK